MATYLRKSSDIVRTSSTVILLISSLIYFSSNFRFPSNILVIFFPLSKRDGAETSFLSSKKQQNTSQQT